MFQRNDCTACSRRHKHPYNSCCCYIKAAIEKDFEPDWEIDEDGYIGEGQTGLQTEVETSLQINLDYSDQLSQASKYIAGSVGQMSQLTMAVNAMTAGEDPPSQEAVPGASHVAADSTAALSVVGGSSGLSWVDSQPGVTTTWPGVVSSHGSLVHTSTMGHQLPVTAATTHHQVHSGIPAGLGRCRTNLIKFFNRHAVPSPAHCPSSESVSRPGWLSGWGSMQSMPRQVGVPLVPPTLMPNSLLHQDWLEQKSPTGRLSAPNIG